MGAPPPPRYLFEVALHGLVGQQQHGAHEVAHQDEVALGLQVERHDVVVVIALGAELLLRRPLVEPHLGRASRFAQSREPGSSRNDCFSKPPSILHLQPHLPKGNAREMLWVALG